MSAAPFLVSWNLTRRCNLRCPHCYLDAQQLDGGEADLTTAEALNVVTQVADFCPGAMLILTGGEPLLREDFWEIASLASRQGLTVVLGTNGTLLTASMVPRLQEIGIQGVGVSLDSIHPAQHDRFRGMSGSWERTVAAVDAMAKAGLDFQMQFTVTRTNYDEIPQLLALAAEKGAKAANVFFLVCTGRGQQMTDITPAQYESMLHYLVTAAAIYQDRLMVRARCAPHFLRLVANDDPDSPMMRGATSGCIAGSGYFRITPEGDVTPCPYLATKAGNLRERSLEEIWNSDPIMQSLRMPHYSGQCGLCSHRQTCGGCRARAYAATGDLMGDDPWCAYDPMAVEAVTASAEPVVAPEWSPESKERLARIPVFLRGMVKSGVERYAVKKGLRLITPELMMTMRSLVHGKR